MRLVLPIVAVLFLLGCSRRRIDSDTIAEIVPGLPAYEADRCSRLFYANHAGYALLLKLTNCPAFIGAMTSGMPWKPYVPASHKQFLQEEHGMMFRAFGWVDAQDWWTFPYDQEMQCFQDWGRNSLSSGTWGKYYYDQTNGVVYVVAGGI